MLYLAIHHRSIFDTAGGESKKRQSLPGLLIMKPVNFQEKIFPISYKNLLDIH
jgi:hypothetical protein